MKKNNFYLLLTTLLSCTLIACDPEPKVTPEPDPTVGMHFDIWTPIGGNAGMGTVDCIIKRTTSLETGEMDFKGSGVDASQKLFPATIIKGKYYYQVTKDGRFGKYQITDNQLVIVKEFPFATLKERRYTHAWLDDNTLLLMGANGDSDKILWVKINAETMTETANGELDLPAPKDGEVFNTSGLAAYRKSDNKVLYSFKYNPTKKNPAPERKEFYMAFINPADMSVAKIVTENRAEFMTSTAYGELRQQKAFFDENGDYYLSCNSVLDPQETDGNGKTTTTAQRGAILRVKNGATDFDKTYNGYTQERGKIITITYLNNGKAVLYMQDPMYTTNTQIWNSKTNPYVFYWIVVDLKTQAITELKDIPFSNGNFSQLASVVGKKAYIGSNPKEGKSGFYIYDIPTGKLTKGMTLAQGYTVDRLVWIND